jgi:hypothetical protein
MATFLQDLSPVNKGIVSCLVLYTIYWIVQYSIKLRRQDAIIRKKGCKPVRKYPHRDPVLGLDIFLENAKLLKTGGFWDRTRERYLSLNTWTFSQLLMGDRIINTTEPENIKAILATQFHEFELPPRRKDVRVLKALSLSNILSNLCFCLIIHSCGNILIEHKDIPTCAGTWNLYHRWQGMGGFKSSSSTQFCEKSDRRPQYLRPPHLGIGLTHS